MVHFPTEYITQSVGLKLEWPLVSRVEAPFVGKGDSKLAHSIMMPPHAMLNQYPANANASTVSYIAIAFIIYLASYVSMM